jgi:hypothetical protein
LLERAAQLPHFADLRLAPIEHTSVSYRGVPAISDGLGF